MANGLAERCAAVAELSSEGLSWVTDPANGETVGPDRKSLVQMLRRGRRRAEKLSRAARTKLSVSVFGPSQAGKSFLVSVLARPEEGRLVADFPGPGGTLDYISEVNPEGEGESTGLVTRFTMTKDPAPAGFPIKLVLLSEADIARLIINSFYMDGDQSEVPPEPSEIAAHLDAFRPKAGPAVAGLSEDEVHEIADYLYGHPTISKSAYAASLRSFWDEAAELAPMLGPKDRAAFLEILWGGHAPLTELYITLAAGLAQIGHAEQVFAPLAALVPRETSIIDVKTLHGLFAGGTDETLALQTAAGAAVQLPRSVVCALAAELVMPMQTQPSDVFATTDLLDFPGARNRFERPLKVTLENPAQSVPEVFLRGKVSYLFDRYVENQEITSMLLCIPDSNMDTVDLPGLVENWIALTHGNTPDKRRDSTCILFFVLTKFDKHLGESAASGGDATRFERRMFASLLEKFGKGRDDWVTGWTPNQPFNNCYWLRNPNFFVDGLINYDENRREVEIRPEKQPRMDELKSGCLEAPSVQKHFANPEAAWDAALSLNDGGVSYLVGELTKVCTPDSKNRQIGSQIEKLAADLASALSPYHVSDDLEKRLEDKRAAAGDLIDDLEEAYHRHRFGALMHSLMVDQDMIEERIARVPSRVRITSAVSSGGAAAGAASDRRSGGLTRPDGRGGGLVRPDRGRAPRKPEPEPEAEAAETSGRIRTITPEKFQSETAVEVWIEGLHAMRSDVEQLQSFGMREGPAGDLVQELIHGLRRMKVEDRIGETLSAISFALTVDKQAPAAAIVCAERINSFVTGLGTDLLAEEDRPRVSAADGSERIVFSGIEEASDMDSLPVEPRPIAEVTWTDWVTAIYAMFEGNAMDGDSGTVDIEQNLRIGRVVTGLSGGSDAGSDAA